MGILNKNITVELIGGLCNQLFQLAFLDYIQSITGYSIFLHSIPYSPHSSISYFDTIFHNWKHLYNNTIPVHTTIGEENLQPKHWKQEILSRIGNIKLHGYFQNYTYILPSFISKLKFNSSILEKYPTLSRMVFLHIRGGDYVNHWLHHINLVDYYKRAILEFEPNTQFSVFTNDVKYASNILSELNTNSTIIEENEIDSLYLMSQCKGGICANSSFSWWGAYLNPNRKIIMPSKWFNDPNLYTDMYYFPNVIKLDV